jgi:peptide-methionine (S)-S-oxide reductase
MSRATARVELKENICNLSGHIQSKGSEEAPMHSPTIGRNLAVAVILLFLGWTAFRALGSRPPAGPLIPIPTPTVDVPLASKKTTETAVFAGGCFWGVQAVFEHIKGVNEVVSGYSGGFVKSPSYETVSLGVTGHAESAHVTFDPSQISYGQLLMVYFSVAHDPTQWNRQGPDTGSQYRSAIFYSSDQQKRVAEAYIEQLGAAHVYTRPIVTKVERLEAFYPAEDYHQNYLKNNPGNSYIIINDLPKLEHLRRDFPNLYRND